VKHFATRQEGALIFNQGSLSRNLQKRNQKETAWLNGEAVDEDEDDRDDDDNDNLVEVTLAEMMDAATKLENGAPMVGGCNPELSSLCRKFRDELRRMMILEAQQTTLDDFFGRNLA
jgi:hypothetical protein